MLKNLPISNSTRNNVAELFRRYGYEYTFHSSNVADIFSVKPAAATAALRKLRKLGVIESLKYGVYQFVKIKIGFSLFGQLDTGLVLRVGGGSGRRI